MAETSRLAPEEWALLQLSLTDGIGPTTARALIESIGSATAVLQLSKKELTRHPNIRPQLARTLLNSRGKEKAEQELKLLEELRHKGTNIRLYFLGNPDYPPQLADCFDAPLVLYVRGEIPGTPMLSIVGTRRNTRYAIDATNYLIEGIARLRPDITIVSGLAYGVDKLAHQAALSNGLKSLAVVAHGHYTIYPGTHRRLAEQIVATGGGIITEYPYATRALPQRFVQRNRIVAALSRATIVVESAKKGGSLITANIAFDYGRSLYVVPGRLFDIYSEGCNLLVERQKASIITTPEKLLSDLDLLPTELKPKQLPFTDEIAEETDPILKALRRDDELTLEDLSLQLGEEVPAISGRLFELELEGYIYSLPGGRYCIRNH